MPQHPYPVPVRPSLPPAPPPNRAVAAIARRALPAAATSMGALVTSLAVERTLARALTLALGRAGQVAASTPFAMIVPRAPRTGVTIVTETTTFERITRRR